MIEDPLEIFIKNNRDDFDTENPSMDVWAKIERATPYMERAAPTLKKARSFTLWRIAAAVALMLTGAALYRGLQKTPLIAANDETPQLTEAEAFYQKQVNQKSSQLAAYHPDPAVMEDLKQMDEVEGELRAELAKAPKSSRQEIIENLIQSYKDKLDILEKVLDKVQENDLQTNKTPQNDTI